MWICCFTHHFVRNGLQVFAKWPEGQNELDHAGLSYSLTHIGHTQSHTKNGYFALVNALLYIHSGLFSHSIKLRNLPLPAVTVSLHYLPRYLRSTASSNMRQNACYPNLKWPWYCYAIKTNSRRIRSQVRSRRGTDVSELQAPYCMTPVPWTWLLCSEIVLVANELSLQELNQIETEQLTLRFLENFVSRSNFQGGKFPFCTPCGRPCLMLCLTTKHIFENFGGNNCPVAFPGYESGVVILTALLAACVYWLKHRLLGGNYAKALL